MRFKINTYITLLLCFLLGGNVFSQAFFNAGGTVYVQDEAELWITGNDGDVEVATGGVFYNSGRLFIEGDWTNNSGSTPFLHNSIYNLGSVSFYRNGNQIITSGITNATEFDTLILTGTGIKELVNVNTIINSHLELDNVEFYTQDNFAHITNTNANGAVNVIGNGFVSSDIEGYLSWDMASTETYAFPVGSSTLLGNPKRTVAISPDNSSTNTFGVRLANIDPSLETNLGISPSGAIGPFDRTNKASQILDINSNYYHNISKLSGNSDATIEIYYDNVIDGNFNSTSQWQDNTLRWERTYFNNTSGSSPYFDGNNVSRASSYDDFNTDVFALANKYELEVIIPGFFSPNKDGLNELFEIPGIENYTDNELLIYNRYGSLVYKKSGYTNVNAWDGTANVQGVELDFNGVAEKGLPDGTYFYILDLKLPNYPAFTGYVELRR